jgi:hypothetical protein
MQGDFAALADPDHSMAGAGASAFSEIVNLGSQGFLLFGLNPC